MGKVWVSWRSIWWGIRAMKRPYPEPKPRWAVDWPPRSQYGWWLHVWTPVWHKGRGPYVSIGLGCIRVCRGY